MPKWQITTKYTHTHTKTQEEAEAEAEAHALTPRGSAGHAHIHGNLSEIRLVCMCARSFDFLCGSCGLLSIVFVPVCRSLYECASVCVSVCPVSCVLHCLRTQTE